jgi:hypothetical protein
MPVLHYKDPNTGEWIPIVTGPKGPKGDKGDPGGVTGPPGTPGATTHTALTDLALQKDEHPQYLKAAGDTVEGMLNIVNDNAELRFQINGVNKFGIRSQQPNSLTILRYISPTVLDAFINMENSTGNMYIGTSASSTLDILMALNVHNAATFSAGANMNDKKVTSVATPTASGDAVNKAYADGAGGIMVVAGNVATGAANHWVGSVGTPTLWGGVISGSDYLMSRKDGWYRCSFNGTFDTNTTGSVREMRLAINGATDHDEIPPGATHIGASTSPKSWAGWGLNLSATGIWHMPVGKVIRLMARHDATASLGVAGTITMELVKAD